MLLMAALCVPWATWGQAISSFPYSTGFESGDDTSWTFVNDATNAWYLGSATASTGTQAIYISNNNGTANSYTNSSIQFSYAYRAFTLTDVAQMAVTFDWKCNGEGNCDYLRAWVAPASFTFTAGQTPNGGTSASGYTTATPTGWIDLGGKMNLQSSWQTTQAICNLAAGSYYLVFMWANDGSAGTTPPAAVDNVSIAEVPCPQPANLAVDALQTQATLSWSPMGTESSWELLFNDSVSTIVTDTFYTVTDLTPWTSYTFAVRAICGAGDSSFWSSYNFTTPCNFLDSLPYVYDFEDATTGGSTNSSFVPCWTRLNNGTSYFGYPYVSSSSTYNHTPSGSKGLYWYNNTTTGTYGDYQCIVLPGVDIDNYPINTLRLLFWSKASSDSYHPEFKVGVMTDPNNINTFTELATINVEGTTWTEYEAYLSAYEGTGRYVAICAYRPTSSWYAYFDDVTLDLLPSCPHVTGLTVDTVGTDFATLSWTPAGEESEWLIWLNDSIIGSTTSYPYFITDLTLNTIYTFGVAALCSDGDTSEVEYISARTLAGEPISTFPYICDFESAESRSVWVLENGTETNQWWMGTAANNGGNYGMYVSNTNGTTHAYSVSDISYVFAYVTFQLDSGDYAYSYDWQCNGESSFDFIRAALVPATVEFTAGGYCGFSNTSALPSGGIAIDGAYRLNLSSAWTTQSGEITVPTSGLYNMVFMWRNDGSGGSTPPAAIDNVMLNINTCPMPTNLTDVYVSSDSITVAWQPGSSETEWVVSNGVDTVVVTSPDTSYTFDQLNSNTLYHITVQAVCSSDDSSLYATINVRTQCGALTQLPYTEDFESYATTTSTSSTFIPCWGHLNNATTYFGYPYLSSTASYNHTDGGARGLYWYNSTTTGTYGDYQILVLPEVDTNTYPINTLMVSFWAKPTSTSYHPVFYVGVMTDPTDDSTFVYYDTINVDDSTTNWDNYAVYFNEYVGPGSYVAIRANRPTSSWYACVDDVILEVIPDCLPVSDITLAGLTSDSLYVTWTEEGDATSWNIEYGPTGFTPGSGTTDIVTSLPYGIGNLTANTVYDVYVTPECPNGNSSSRMATFYTDCGPTPVPFTENFDTWSSTIADPLPNCWEKHTNYSSNYPSASTSYSHSGSGKSMYMYSTSSYYSYMVLPAFDLPIDSTVVSFWLYKSNSSYDHKLVVGVMTNPSDVTTFTAVDTVVPSLLSTWEEFEVTFGAYSGTGTRIAIMSPDGEYSYPYLDDLTVTRMTGCFRVENLTAATVLLDSAVITWSDNVNTGWTVEYDTVDFVPGTNHNPVHVTDTFYVMSGLSAATTYYVYVYPDCDAISDRSISFTTLASAPATVPYTCDFEATDTNGWDLIQSGQANYWMVGSATSNGGTQSLFVTNDGSTNSYSGAASYSFAVRTFNLPAGNYVCSFDWKAQGESSCDFIRAALVPASTEIVAGAYNGFNNTSGVPTGSIAIDGAYRLNLQGSTWQTEVTEFTLENSGTYKMVFMWRNDGSVYNAPAGAIDNVSLILNTCPMPANVTASNISQTSATVSWTEVGNATTWEYQLDNNTPVVVTDTFCNLSNLTSNTVYTFKVRSICGTGDTGMWSTTNFRTLCGYLALPYTEDFENETTGSSTTGSAFVNCWNRLNNGTSYGGYPYVSSSTTYNHTTGGTKGLYWYASTTTGTYGDYHCIVLPAVDSTVGVDSLQVSFWVKASSASYTPVFKVGVMTDTNNIASFVGIDTITVNSTSWTLVEVPLTAYTGTGRFVAIKADRPSSTWTAYVDDVTLEYIPTCLMPQDVYSTTASTTSITLDWTDVGTPSAWEIRYDTSANSTVLVFATSHPFTVTGLSSQTSYTFEVRAICTAGDTSRWSNPVTLSTEMCDNAVAATTGTASGAQYYTPLNNYYNYTLTETIIDSAELAGVGDLVAVAYSYAGTASSTMKTDVDIWLQPTTKTAFSSNTDLDVLDTTIAVKVYSGDLNCDPGWNYFAFDTLYTWDGHSNLMVIVDDNSGDYDGNTYTFNNSACSGYKTLVWYSDSYDPDPLNSNYTGNKTYYQYRATMKLVSCGASCAVPTILTPSAVDYQQATLNWNSNATEFEVAVKATSDAAWPEAVTVTNALSYTVTGLAPATNYMFRVRAICDATEDMISDWGVGTFVTDSLPCFAPSNVEAEAQGQQAIISWTAGGNETEWTIHVFNTTFDQEYTATANPYTVTGLTANVTYNVAVSANCGGGLIQSDWSDTTSFTTVPCDPVTNVTASNVTGTSATVTWTAGENNTNSWEISWNYQGAGMTNLLGTATVSAATYDITGLTANTPYEVYVRAICAEGYNSDYATTTFTTQDVGIAHVEDGLNLSIFPNPATGNTTITLSGVNGNVTLSVVDMSGRTVQSTTMECSGDCEKSINVDNLAAGAYFVRVYGDNVNTVKKLIVK